jgi:hypothetical protein
MFVELKRRDGGPLYASAGAVSAWTASPEASGLTDIWIGGKMFTLGMTVQEVTQKLYRQASKAKEDVA